MKCFVFAAFIVVFAVITHQISISVVDPNTGELIEYEYRCENDDFTLSEDATKMFDKCVKESKLSGNSVLDFLICDNVEEDNIEKYTDYVTCYLKELGVSSEFPEDQLKETLGISDEKVAEVKKECDGEDTTIVDKFRCYNKYCK